MSTNLSALTFAGIDMVDNVSIVNKTNEMGNQRWHRDERINERGEQ